MFGINKKRREKDLKMLMDAMKASNPMFGNVRFTWNSAVYPSYNIEQLIDSSFYSNIDFYAVIKRMTGKFGHLPRYVYKEKVKAKKVSKKSLDSEIADGELMQLLLKPNDSQGQDLFFESIALQYLLTGEAFIWKNRGGLEKGKPVELVVFPSAFMTIVPDPYKVFTVASYELNLFGRKIPIPKEDIIHWKTANPTYDSNGSQLRGFNPLGPQRRIITESNAATDSSVAMFQNNGVRAILTNKTYDSLSTEQMTTLKNVIDRKLNNNDATGAIAAIQGEWDLHDLSKSAVDMALMEADEKIVKKICNANGLPYELFQSDTTFANKKEAWYFFITNTLMPMAASLDGELTKSLTVDFGEKGSFIQTDFHELPEMQALRLEMAKAVSTMPELTLNEKRQIQGFEPYPHPMMDVPLVNPGLVPIDDLGIDMEEDEPKDNSKKDYGL